MLDTCQQLPTKVNLTEIRMYGICKNMSNQSILYNYAYTDLTYIHYITQIGGIVKNILTRYKI